MSDGGLATVSLQDLRLALEERLPEHTFNAVMRRADALGSDRERCELLSGILAKREAAEEA